MKKITSFILICLCALGSIGGLGWALYERAWVIAAGIVGLSISAWPTIVNYYKNLTEGDR